jgi:hypothetical protein
MSGSEGSDFVFRCVTSDGSSTQIGVARAYDESGGYTPATPTTTLVADVMTEVAIAQVVTAFSLAKSANPNNGSVLDVSGFYSNASSMDVANSASVTLPQ